eukprot:COSAG03_NODE_157_length_11420_cov_28.022083_11_plen_265_part_00
MLPLAARLQVDLDADLTKSPAVARLPANLGSANLLPGPLVVQLVSCVDVARPAAQRRSQEPQGCLPAPEPSSSRMLLLTLTDGQAECRGLELCSISQLSAALCVPGTKLALQGVPVRKGMLLLSPSSTRVLGGRVPALIKQHEMMQAHEALGAERLGKDGSTGPPPFVDLPGEGESAAVQTAAPPAGQQTKNPKVPRQSAAASQRSSTAVGMGGAQTKSQFASRPERQQQPQQQQQQQPPPPQPPQQPQSEAGEDGGTEDGVHQ